MNTPRRCSICGTPVGKGEYGLSHCPVCYVEYPETPDDRDYEEFARTWLNDDELGYDDGEEEHPRREDGGL